MNAMPAAKTHADLSLAGARLSPPVARCVSQIVVRQTINAPSVAEVTMINPPSGTRDLFAANTALQVSTADGVRLFSGSVTGVDHVFAADGRQVMKVRAYDVLHKLRLRRRFRMLENTSPDKALGEAAEELGVALAATTAGVSGRFVQAGESDLAFLARIARQQGLAFHFDGTTLAIFSLSGSGDPVELAWGDTLIAAQIGDAGEDVARSGRAFGWNAATAEGYTALANLARQDEDIELRGFGLGELGAGEGELFRPNGVAGSQAEVAALAQDLLDRAAAAQTIAQGAARGSADLRPGVRVRLTGLKTQDPATFVLTQTTHVFDAMQGYVTEFSSEPPPDRQCIGSPVVTLAVVDDINDPRGGARCRVSLPAFGQLQLGFLDVLVAGAGPGKGAAALPDTGDQVVVMFPTGDLAHGFILGGLYGLERLPRGSSTQTPRAMVLSSGGAQRLVLGGARNTVALSTSLGDTIALGGGASQLAVGGDLSIIAANGTITIKAKHVKFERG